MCGIASMLLWSRWIFYFFVFFFYFFLFFFFFQAEDGIRDGTVTAVQTCALPISRAAGGARSACAARRGARSAPSAPPGIRPPRRARPRTAPPPSCRCLRRPAAAGSSARVCRSEERRVGKDCRTCLWCVSLEL